MNFQSFWPTLGISPKRNVWPTFKLLHFCGFGGREDGFWVVGEGGRGWECGKSVGLSSGIMGQHQEVFATLDNAWQFILFFKFLLKTHFLTIGFAIVRTKTTDLSTLCTPACPSAPPPPSMTGKTPSGTLNMFFMMVRCVSTYTMNETVH